MEAQIPKLDTLKLLSAALVLLVAFVAFYYFSDYLLVVRVLGLLTAVAVAAGILLTTAVGSGFLNFLQESRAELRKVVWPSRNETLQTSLAVIVMVIVMGIFLWLLDMLLFWVVRLLTGQGG
ncbi:MAG: preprotein translocase subunit SecE [Pseudomonadota bacterium]|nr:preprotein translocase subunit SecE [Pseudomonadota bacterium]